MFVFSINGREVGSKDQSRPTTFKDVKLWAGDNFLPTADVELRNFKLNYNPTTTPQPPTILSGNTIFFCASAVYCTSF